MFLGASVYWIYEKNGKCYVHDDMLVVQRVSEDELGFHYSLENASEERIDWCRQEDVFGTRETAEQECEKRNLNKHTIGE